MIALLAAIIALMAFAVLLYPIKISFNSVRSEGTIDGSLGISWIIFLFIYSMKEKELKIHIFGRSMTRSSQRKPQVKKTGRKRKKSGKMPPVKDFLNMTGPLLQFFKDFIYAFRIKYLDIEVNFGLNEPAHTGIITGFMHALGLSRLRHNIRWTPDFTGQALYWDVNGEVALIPVRLIPPVARFIANPQVLRSGLRIIRG